MPDFSFYPLPLQPFRKGLHLKEMKMDDKKLRNITREFNRWRYPECRARTIKNDDEKLIIQFDGTFSFSCCFDEHFEDFRIMLEEKGGVVRKINLAIFILHNGWDAIGIRK